MLARRALLILGIVGVALLLVAAWNGSLRRQVAQATEPLRVANHEILDSKAFLDSVIESLPVAIFGKDPQKGFIFTLWNARSEQIFGLRKEDVLGKTDSDFFPKTQVDSFREKDLEVIRAGKTLDIANEQILSRSLGLITLQTRKVPLFDEAGAPILLLGISENITERLTLEEALRQAQKLESLGVLAGGIAHDFNNLFTAMLGNLGLATLHIPEGNPAIPYLRNAEATALRAAELTHQLLAYSGKGMFVVKPMDLGKAAREIASLLKVSISKKVNLRFEFPEGLPLIMADPAHLQQVMMNLVTNASEAIGDVEGEILLATRAVEVDALQAAVLHPGSPIAPGRYVILCVKDNGAGMTPEILSRIFDPFFTTEFSSRGLGMSAMLGILRAHHAGISIQSAPGQGAEFCLYFPAEGATVREAPAPSTPVAKRPTPGGTVILVEDEPEILQATGAMLRKAGFTVLEAMDGVQALESYRQHPGSIRSS